MKKATLFIESPSARATIEVELRWREAAYPHLTIDLAPVTMFTELALSMQGSERVRGRWQETVSGQGRDFVASHFADDARIVELSEIWERWHLNGFRPGHRAQREYLDARRNEIDLLQKDRGVDRYTLETELLTRAGCNPHNGYHYSDAWLVELLPEGVLARLETLTTELGGRFVENTEVA